jgi:hypothetical protein
MNVIKIKDGFIIEAEYGMILRRLSDGQLFGSPLRLGKAYLINGQPLEEPIDELPEHYEEIPIEKDPVDILEQESEKNRRTV